MRKIHYLLACLVLVITIKTTAQEKPNILVILADDLGYGDVGFTGSTEIKTPNLDKLAKNGVIFKNGYVTHPYCGPSRAGLLTGRYQARFGLEINLTNSPFDMYNGLPLTEQTFANRLKKSGYTTGIIGKWHMGGSEPFHPNNRGFDYFYGFLAGGHSYFPENVKTVAPLVSEKTGEPAYSANEGSYHPLTRNDKAGEFNEYLTTALSKDAAKFIGDSKKPFCLYMAYNAPHLPLEAPKETIDKYKNIKDPQRRVYAAMIDKMDEGVGIIIKALKDSGKYDNTLIFFLSDNGGPRAEKQGHGFAFNGPFVGGKGSMHEGGSHVPFFLHWPNGNLKKGVFEGLVSSLDISATAVALGNGDTSGEKLEGTNLIPFLTGAKKGTPHDALFWRMDDGKAWSVRTEKTKYLLEGYGKNVQPELFDMEKDPYESTNIVSNSAKDKAAMAKLWNEWNQGNISNSFLQAGPYQKKRLEMYKKLYDDLHEKAKKQKLLIIE
ncbi:sulfatase-like hydrolase/transferase [Flavobacterium ovatum]|uniref:sulfatase family protein n=1 Tax=Flavobacterium ovatum TaxID=1928857 RepID=UPI00344BA480